jgi:hypothetical protein
MPLTKVSAGVIAANAVVDSFGTQSITGDKIGLGAITGNTLASNIINANNIVNATITGAKLAANTVSGDVIGQNAISSNNIVSVNASIATVGTLPKARLPTGSVLQVVSQQAPANYTSTSSALTLLTQSFTPTSATSKVLAFMSYVVERNGGNSAHYIFVNFNRDGSTIVSQWGNGTGFQESSGARGVATHTYLDSPATTSAISYTFVADFSASGNVPYQFYTMQLTLLEIAA